jgi:hypothetical protein
MLKIPSFRKIGDVTVYQDDAVWHRFYPLASRPTIRRDADGRPIFLLALHHFSEAAREADPTLPRGAGYMSFDVQLAIDDPTADDITRELQGWVDEEHARRGGAGQPPRVELAAPLLSGGKVTMHTTQSARLTTARLAEVPASLVADSNAVFNVDLTDEGANFMRGILLGEGGRGAADLTGIQAIYDLTMWARLPPVKLTLSAESTRVHQTLLELSETNRDQPCTPAEVESYRQSGVSSSHLHESGLVKVEIDKGDATLPEEAMQSLQDFAFDLFDKMITERFLVPAEEDPRDLDFDDLPPLEGADPGWAAMLYTDTQFRGDALELRESLGNLGAVHNAKVRSIRVRRGHSVTLYSGHDHTGSTYVFRASDGQVLPAAAGRARSARVTRSPVSRSRVRKTVNHATMDLRIVIDRSQVVEWPVGGQATLETFFAGRSAQEMKRHVVEIREDFFQTLGVEVRAVVDFARSPVALVEVHLEYPAGASREGGTPTNTFSFDAGNTAPRRFDPSVVGGNRSYRYRYRLVYDDGLQTDYTEWETTTRRNLNIATLDPGKLALDVSAASLNWNLVSAVVVSLTYTHPAGDVPTVARAFELTELVPVGRWEHRLHKALEGHVEATFSYRMKDEKVVEGEPQQILASANLLVVRPPQVDVLNVGLVPAGDWSDVVQALVMLEYDAGGGIVFDRAFRFTAIDQHAEWQVLLRDPTRRTFSYQVLVTYRNGDSESQPKRTASGDQQIAIKVGEPKHVITVLASLVDFEQTPTVTVALDYHGQTKVITFTKPGTEAFKAPRRADGRRDYTYQVSWYTPDGRRIDSGVRRSDDEQLVLTRPTLPQAGKLEVIVRGFAVDFAATPYVDVQLRWDDGGREESKLVTLHEGERTVTWSVDIGDRTNRRYAYAVTYNLADGTRVAGPAGESTDPVVSITPYRS